MINKTIVEQENLYIIHFLFFSFFFLRRDALFFMWPYLYFIGDSNVKKYLNTTTNEVDNDRTKKKKEKSRQGEIIKKEKEGK